MGKRCGYSLTEQEYIGIKRLLKDRKDLYYFMEVMIKTGIRRSEWKNLAEAADKYKTRSFEILIPKQSKVSAKAKNELRHLKNISSTHYAGNYYKRIEKLEGEVKLVKRLIKLPIEVWNAIQSGEYILKPNGHEWVRQKTDQIKKIIKGTKYDRPLSPHDFRHTFIMFAKHRGWDIFDVQSTTKHASIDSLIKYYASDTDTIEAVYDSMEKDYYDITNIPKLLKRMNMLEQENKLLKEKLNETN